MEGQTDGQTDRQTETDQWMDVPLKRGVEVRSMQLKNQNNRHNTKKECNFFKKLQLTV